MFNCADYIYYHHVILGTLTDKCRVCKNHLAFADVSIIDWLGLGVDKRHLAIWGVFFLVANTRAIGTIRWYSGTTIYIKCFCASKNVVNILSLVPFNFDYGVAFSADLPFKTRTGTVTLQYVITLVVVSKYTKMGGWLDIAPIRQ